MLFLTAWYNIFLRFQRLPCRQHYVNVQPVGVQREAIGASVNCHRLTPRLPNLHFLFCLGTCLLYFPPLRIIENLGDQTFQI